MSKGGGEEAVQSICMEKGGEDGDVDSEEEAMEGDEIEGRSNSSHWWYSKERQNSVYSFSCTVHIKGKQSVYCVILTGTGSTAGQIDAKGKNRQPRGREQMENRSRRTLLDMEIYREKERERGKKTERNKTNQS